jgi:predicted transcriptional regulator
MQRELVITRRGRMDIVADILRATREGAKKTRIIFRARLNNEQCKKYLRFMMRKDLIEAEKRGKHVLYRTTDKGSEFIREYRALREFLT